MILTLSVDTVRPTIAITSAASSLKWRDNDATFTLSEASTDFVNIDIQCYWRIVIKFLRHHPVQFIQQTIHQIVQLME